MDLIQSYKAKDEIPTIVYENIIYMAAILSSRFPLYYFEIYCFRRFYLFIFYIWDLINYNSAFYWAILNNSNVIITFGKISWKVRCRIAIFYLYKTMSTILVDNW